MMNFAEQSNQKVKKMNKKLKFQYIYKKNPSAMCSSGHNNAYTTSSLAFTAFLYYITVNYLLYCCLLKNMLTCAQKCALVSCSFVYIFLPDLINVDKQHLAELLTSNNHSYYFIDTDFSMTGTANVHYSSTI